MTTHPLGPSQRRAWTRSTNGDAALVAGPAGPYPERHTERGRRTTIGTTTRRSGALAARTFWASVGVIAYTYAVFPTVLWLRARLRPRPHATDDVCPRATVVIAAHNEAAHIQARLDNLVAADYPADCLDIIVVSDGSTDETEQIVASYPDPRVTLLALPRGGKARALNAAMTIATGDVVVFSDANTHFAPDALRALARPFADPEVGGAAGDQRYVDHRTHDDGGERSYWNFDRQLKRWESAAGNVVHATGAIYAVRRNLIRPVRDGISDDFIISTAVIEQGHRLVFVADAVAYEPTASSPNAEFRRKVRIGTRMLRSEFLARPLMNPFRYGFYALQLFSHKPLRRLMGLPVLAIAFTTPWLWGRGGYYRLAAWAQAAFYANAAIGLRMLLAGTTAPAAMRLPAYFCLVYAAQLVALWNVVRGRRVSVWERGPRR